MRGLTWNFHIFIISFDVVLVHFNNMIFHKFIDKVLKHCLKSFATTLIINI